VTDHNHCQCPCPHQWTQPAPFTPAWVLSMPPTTVCPHPNHPVTPNPVFPGTATLPMYTPLELKKTGPCSVLVTVSIPTESISTLPTKTLEIKMVKKTLKITQCRLFNGFPAVHGIPHDTPKLFLGGFVRKDLQYSEPICHTATTVEGTIKDFVIDIPFTCVVDLGCLHAISPILFSQRQEYEFLNTKSLPSGFSSKDKLMSSDSTEFNVVSQQFLNALPNCELIFSQINEMDDALDRIPLPYGPFEEGVFRTLQEKMIILVQLRLTFPTAIDSSDTHCDCLEPSCDDHCCTNVCCHNNPLFLTIPKFLKSVLRCMAR